MSAIARMPKRGGISGLEVWLRKAMAQLTAVTDTARLDAELLAAHALDMSREEMILALPRLDAPGSADELLARRLAGEPIAIITGARDFWTLTLKVTPDVLVPRPDSETQIEAAINWFGDPADLESDPARKPRRILDLGTGSGALLLAALDVWREASGLGIDVSPAALAVAQDNAARCGMADRADFRTGDWAKGLAETFDLVLCNPPYIRLDAMLPREVVDHEPSLALFGGADGLDAYRVLARQIGGLIAPGGAAFFEIGFDQGESAALLFRENGLDVALRQDLAGRARCLRVTV